MAEKCPRCGGAVWSNVKENDTRAKNGEKLRPDYSCKDKDGCKWVQWREKPAKVKAPVVRTAEEEKIFHSADNLPPVKTEVFQGTKKEEKIDPEKKMWAEKEKREHKRALTMQAFGLFPPRTNEDGVEPMDRWMAIRDMRDIMLNDLYCDEAIKPF